MIWFLALCMVLSSLVTGAAILGIVATLQSHQHQIDSLDRARARERHAFVHRVHTPATDYRQN